MGLVRHLVSIVWRAVLYRWREWRGLPQTNVRGVRLEFPPGAGEDLRRALYREVYELPESNAMRTLLAPGDRLLELGTAIGYVAIEAARRLGDENVVTVEANPETADYARRNFARNGAAPNLLIGLAGAGPAASGAEKFFVYDDFWASSTRPLKGGSGERQIETPVVDVNTLIRERAINALICDIEGAEVELFEKLDLAPLDKLIVEFHPDATGEDAFRRTLMLLLAAGFSLDMRASSDCTLALRRCAWRRCALSPG